MSVLGAASGAASSSALRQSNVPARLVSAAFTTRYSVCTKNGGRGTLPELLELRPRPFIARCSSSDIARRTASTTNGRFACPLDCATCSITTRLRGSHGSKHGRYASSSVLDAPSGMSSGVSAKITLCINVELSMRWWHISTVGIADSSGATIATSDARCTINSAFEFVSLMAIF